MRFSFLIAPALVCAFSLTGFTATNGIDAVLARMDQSAAKFNALSANLRRVSFTAVLNETTSESGTILIRRPKPRDVQMLVEIREPDQKSVSYMNRKWQIFYPKINTVQEYDLGKQGALIDQALLLGFGTSTPELLRHYDVKYVGEDVVEGTPASRLELVPKSKEALRHIARVELWISEQGHPVQQKIYQPSKDYYLITYSDIKLNPNVTADSVKLKLPKNVKKEYPQR
ncbi:MAG: outer membrane lipoprotein carrier protein LolA [Bryobacteraceae bacterium]|nr:outer membrane lipoprotein carrier protein LolA [Bryobacteraceae bacterium]